MAAQDERQVALTNALAQIERQFGKGSIMRMGDFQERMAFEVIPSGSIALDLALGVGGFPRGRIVEIYGPESSGKTTLALHAIAEAQKTGGTAAFIDVEHALDPNYAAALGVDLDNLLVSQPDTGEQALEIAEMLTRSNAVDVIVVDSVAALVTRAELEGDMGDAHVGLQARLMSQALRKLTAAISRSKTVMIFINQLREKIGVMFGNPETTSGGRALKFYASVRLDVRKLETIKVGQDVVGTRTRVKVVKNKVRAAVPAGRVRHHLRPRHLEDGLDSRRRARPATSSARAARGTPTASSASAKAARTPRRSSKSTPISPPRSKRRSARRSASQLRPTAKARRGRRSRQ